MAAVSARGREVRTWCNRLFAFHEFPKQFPDLVLRGFEGFPATGRRSIDLPQGLAVPFLFQPQVALLFEAVQYWVQTAWTDLVAVTREFLDHAKAEDGLLNGVMKHVQPDHPRVQVPIRTERVLLGFRFRHSIYAGG